MQDIWPQVIAGFKAISGVEWAAVASSLACVYLTVRNNIWNWFFGFIGVVLYGYLFWQWKNYANCGLQLLYYVPIQFIGWYVWSRGGKSDTEEVPITQLTPAGRVKALGVVAVLTAVFYGAFRYWLPAAFPSLPRDPVPFGDGLTTAISIVAQYLQVHKRFENWLFWIAADVLYAAYVFPVQQLYASTLLYVVFTALAIVGAREWRQKLREQEAGANGGAALPAGASPEPAGGAGAAAVAIAEAER